MLHLTRKSIHVCKLSARDKFMEITEALEFQVTGIYAVYIRGYKMHYNL